MILGDLLDLDVLKPAAGGRMLARHEGQVVLVARAIPGERVRARVERVAKGVVYADTVDVLTASPDRRAGLADWRCGGSVLSHVAYPRQTRLKGEIVADAFARIARVPMAVPPEVIGSPEQGYRMRARLHGRRGRIGFFREGSHDLCDAATTGQLLPATTRWIAEAEAVLRDARLTGLVWLELAENVPGDQRACAFEVAAGERHARYQPLAELAGQEVSDVLHARPGDPAAALRLRRDARAFFQGNRFLLERLMQHVVALASEGPVIDLYAGVGLFGLSLAAAGRAAVTLVEGDPISSGDLARNAEPFGSRVIVQRRSVESFLGGVQRARGPVGGTGHTNAAGHGPFSGAVVIVDPPRTGLSREAAAGLIALGPAQIVYVSCDVATLARDTRALLDAGYTLGTVTGFDLFPNTAHVEVVASFHASEASR